MGGTSKKRTVLIGIAGMAVVLAACGIGETHEADQVTDVSAVVTGAVKSTVTGPTTYDFEYGPTTAYGSTTPVGTVQITDTSVGIPVSATVIGLAEGTDYHYRLCAYASGGGGSCGADVTFTTSEARDTVTGTGFVASDPAHGVAVGFAATVDAEADGSFASGGTTLFGTSGAVRTGGATCLQAIGNRASIGVMVSLDGNDPTPWMVFVEDNGPTGDRWAARPIADPATSCPYPFVTEFVATALGGGATAGPTLVEGDFVVHDHQNAG